MSESIVKAMSDLTSNVSFGGGGGGGGITKTITTSQTSTKTSRYTGNSCTASGLGKSILEGAIIGGASGATIGSLEPGGGTIGGGLIGGAGGAVTGGVAHTLGCIW